MLAVVSDRRHSIDNNSDGEADYYEPAILSAVDHYPFGFEMPGRKYQFGDYRYGFNGKESDTDGEWSALTHYDYGFRIYNPAIGKFLSVDPLTRDYPSWTPYAFAMNRVVDGVDLDGLEYLDSKESFYDISFGQTWLKRERFFDVFGSVQGSRIAGTIRSDAYGVQYIGSTIPVQKIKFPDNTPWRNVHESRALERNLRSIGERMGTIYENTPRRRDLQPDRRYYSTKIYEGSASSAAALGKVGLAFIAVDLSIDLYQGVKGYFDTKEDQAQQEYIRRSWQSVAIAYDKGLIPLEHQNIEDYSKMADFIFQGTAIEDARLFDIAKQISKEVAKNYRYELDSYEMDSGLDNYPARREYYYQLDVDINKGENE